VYAAKVQQKVCVRVSNFLLSAVVAPCFLYLFPTKVFEYLRILLCANWCDYFSSVRCSLFVTL